MNTKEHKPLFIGFSSQKGGVGKSTLAEVISSILYYEQAINLFVIDCDSSQDSFFKLRQREKECIENSPELTKFMEAYFNKHKRVAFRILKAFPKDAISLAVSYIKKREDMFDVVIFDFPGHVGTGDLLELSLSMDYIISPIESDVQSLVTCMTYAKSIQDLGVSMSESNVKDVIMVWNKVDRRVKNNIIEIYSNYIRQEGVSLLEQHIYSAHRFSHELPLYGIKGVFRSTYLAPNKALRMGTGIDEVIIEILNKLNIKSKIDGNN